MAGKIPTQDFTGTRGGSATGVSSVDQIKTMLDTIIKFFSPLTTHSTGEGGGIHADNLHASSGIAKTTEIPAAVVAALPAAMVTEKVVTADDATIFEADETTVKEATHAASADSADSASACSGNAVTATTATIANAAKGTTRFQISGNFLATETAKSIAGSGYQYLNGFYCPLLAGKALKLKGVRIYVNTNTLRFIFTGYGSHATPQYLSTSNQVDDQTLDATITPSVDNWVAVYIKNPTGGAVNLTNAMWWLDLAIEDV